VHVCPPVLGYTPFLVALRDVVLHGARPALEGEESSTPLLERTFEPRFDEDAPAVLVMVGASLAGSLGAGDGPALRFSDPDAFARVRGSRGAQLAFLEWVRAESPALEAFVWSTCQRTELYAWLPAGGDAARGDEFVARALPKLFGSIPAGIEINVLRGPEARRHLARTACGLNSDLPGDRDVAAQLQTACRIARCARVAGPRAVRLVDETVALVREVLERTAWGRFATGYCEAALARVCEEDGLEPDELRHVVIGGSTTSRSVLGLLTGSYAVPQRALTVAYRDHHGQMKQLRAAVGGGRRLRVHSYADERVLRAVADADVVVFGIDQPDPVLDATALDELRDFVLRPLVIVDFNSSGSVREEALPAGVRLWTATRLDRAVAAYAAISTTRDGFQRAVAEAEAFVLERLSGPRACGSTGRGEAGSLPAARPC
jgi:glutamyl-tRNA reductase